MSEHRLCLSACALVFLGCSTAAPAGSVRPAERELLPSSSELLVALPDGRLVVQVGTSLALVDPALPDEDPMVVGAASEIGRVHIAVEDGDAVLILAESGSYVLRAGSWIPTRFAAALDGPIRGAVRVSTPTGVGLGDLWVLTDTSLYRVVDGVAERFEVADDLGGAQLAAVRRPEGPALWIRLSDRLLEVYRDRSGVLRSVRLALDLVPTAIAGDRAGRGWMILDGELAVLGLDRALVRYGVAVERLLGDARSPDVWAFGEQTWVGSVGAIYEVEGLVVPADAPRALAVDGSLDVSLEGVVRRFNSRQEVTLRGPGDGALLGAPTVFEVLAPGDPHIEAEIDGAGLELSGRSLTLTPSELGDGEHMLVVQVSYDDGTLPTEERRTLEVIASATWTEHVEPLYQAYCAACHGADGPANTRLDAAEGWMGSDLAERILRNVREGRMPLNREPLSQREVALIEAWMVNGFAP